MPKGSWPEPESSCCGIYGKDVSRHDLPSQATHPVSACHLPEGCLSSPFYLLVRKVDKGRWENMQHLRNIPVYYELFLTIFSLWTLFAFEAYMFLSWHLKMLTGAWVISLEGGLTEEASCVKGSLHSAQAMPLCGYKSGGINILCRWMVRL